MPKIVKSGIVYSSGSTMPAANIPYTPPTGSGSSATTAKAALDEALNGIKDLKSNVSTVTSTANTNKTNITNLTTRVGTAETSITSLKSTVTSLNTTSSLTVTAISDSYTSAKNITATKVGHVIIVRGSLTIKTAIPKGSSFNICSLPTATATAATSGNTADAFARSTTTLVGSTEATNTVTLAPTTVAVLLPCAVTLTTATIAFSNATDAIPAGSTITFTMVYIAK